MLFALFQFILKLVGDDENDGIWISCFHAALTPLDYYCLGVGVVTIKQ